MKRSTIPTWGIALSIFAVVLAACAPALATAPTAASTSAVPVTGNSTSPTATTVMATQAVAPTDSANYGPTSTPAAGASASTASGITYVLVADKSVASYQVREQLARLNAPSDAIGKTTAITGSVVLHPDGSIDAASKFTVDLSTLQTDSSMRDGYVSRAILQTNTYPQAVFVPTQVSGLPATIPTSGNVTFKVTGNMTIHNVTKPVTWDVTGSITNGEALGTATTNFTFEDFGLNQPHVSVVLSVVDKITLNVTVALKRSGN